MPKLQVLVVSYLAICAVYYVAVKQLYPSSYQVQGEIGDCCCVSARTLKETNDQINDRLVELVNQKFFRYFKVDIDQDCPFWAQNSICLYSSCAVCRCDEEMIPRVWIEQEKTDRLKLNRTYDPHWPKDQSMSKDDQWHWRVEEFEHEKGVYVDLRENDESYTGYQGQHIWKIIYQENCFQGELENMCSEERTLNRILMGLHSSVSSHLSEYYQDLEKHKSHKYANVDLYFQKVGDYPERIRNLYYYYSFLLRAINSAANKLAAYNYTSDDAKSDARTAQLIEEILDITMGQCDTPFQENEFMSSIRSREVRAEFQNYIHNISRLMDCVECEKCKTFGKMQVYGIGTALKILFSDDPGSYLHVIRRNELVSLINAFAKASTSLRILDKMHERRQMQIFQRGLIVLAPLGIAVAFYAFVSAYSNNKKKKQESKKLKTQ